MKRGWADRIFNLKNQMEFAELAIEIFNYQAHSNHVYHNYITGLGRSIDSVISLGDIPFLPVEFFRSQRVISDNLANQTIFESSGTTESNTSRHYVHDLKIYEESFLKAFNQFYGDPSEYLITALLPSYTDRGNSSLVYMVSNLINKSGHTDSGFYADNIKDLINKVQKAKSRRQKTLLLGVSFALLDLAENYSPDFSGTIVMETGGMKGRRREITREELHGILANKFNVPVIHSEYGMTELMSQSYSKGKGIYYSPPWMKILLRDPQDPLSVFSESGRTGGINIIDLANIYSCSFIATSDLGKLHEDGGFEVLGRFDNSDIRGCNLMVE